MIKEIIISELGGRALSQARLQDGLNSFWGTGPTRTGGSDLKISPAF